MITKRVANHRSERLRGLDNEKMYKLTRAVIAVVFDFVEKDRRKEKEDVLVLKDERGKMQPDPLHNQVADGIFLELNASPEWQPYPFRLWTMWGRLDFASEGEGDWETVIRSFLRGFGAQLHRERWVIPSGVRGPVYALHRVGGVTLPEPVELNPDAYFKDASYEDILAHWELHKKQHH